MANAIIKLIHQHGSVRNYKSDEVSRDLVEKIVLAGQRASTSSNLQMYSVVAVTEFDNRKRVQELCGNQKHISQAPVFLTWCADLSRLDRICTSKNRTHQGGYGNRRDRPPAG